MMHIKKNRFGFAGLVFGGAMLVLVGNLSSVIAQEPAEIPSKQSPAKTRNFNSGRDPFKKYEPPKVRRVAGGIAIPTIDERINMYKAQKQLAMNARVQAPKPTTALLLSEIQVVGITRTPRGYAAIIEAMPIKLSYVIYPGEHFYDGQLVAIEDTRLVFRRETVLTDGRRERSVEMKSLRQPNGADTKSRPSVAASETQKNESVAAAKP
jgi:hypothetical protein